MVASPLPHTALQARALQISLLQPMLRTESTELLFVAALVSLAAAVEGLAVLCLGSRHRLDRLVSDRSSLVLIRSAGVLNYLSPWSGGRSFPTVASRPALAASAHQHNEQPARPSFARGILTSDGNRYTAGPAVSAARRRARFGFATSPAPFHGVAAPAHRPGARGTPKTGSPLSATLKP